MLHIDVVVEIIPQQRYQNCSIVVLRQLLGVYSERSSFRNTNWTKDSSVITE